MKYQPNNRIQVTLITYYLNSATMYSQKSIEHWTKGCILPFPNKGELTVIDNYRGITLTCIAAKIYNTLLRDRIQPTLDMILRPNQNGFRNNRSTVGQILTVRTMEQQI